MEMVQRTLDVERVVNLVAAFGWKKIKEDVAGDKLVITIEKTVEPEPASATPTKFPSISS